MSRLLAIILATWPAMARVPEFYRSVDRVTWVVDDLDRVTAGWDKVGFLKIEHRGDIEMPVTFRGQATKAKVRMATGFLGDVRVTWIEPLGATS